MGDEIFTSGDSTSLNPNCHVDSSSDAVNQAYVNDIMEVSALKVANEERRRRGTEDSGIVTYGDVSKSGSNLIQRRSVHNISSFSDNQVSVKDGIVGIFVVAFDTRAGNVIEWQWPRDVELTGIEFKALASGFHKVSNDFVYFRRERLFGVACFEKRSVEGTDERGARMKSVGVVTTEYRSLSRHLAFLQQQVRLLLDTPGQYQPLISYWHSHRLVLSVAEGSVAGTVSGIAGTTTEAEGSLAGTLTAGLDSEDGHSEAVSSSMLSVHVSADQSPQTSDCTDLLEMFGARLMTLWKLLLLRCRVLFYAPPPLGVTCQRISSIAAMLTHTHHTALATGGPIQPYFCVSVADVSSLETEYSYIACTTDSIFKLKTSLYDVLVTDQEISVSSERLKSLLRVTRGDKERWGKLSKLWDQSSGLSAEAKLDLFTRYFEQLNDSVFSLLIDVGEREEEERVVRNRELDKICMSSVEDRLFMSMLLRVYGIDITIEDKVCCPEALMCC